MIASPRSGKLYRTLLWAVISTATASLLASFAFAQFERKPKPDQGPRALGLLEIVPNGTAHLIPIAIMYNGNFYDAGIYKADPVPMALYSGTVYEGERSGISQGLFTVAGALESRGTFIGTGQWLTAAEVKTATAARAKRKDAKISSVPRGMEDDSGPPRLAYPKSDKDKNVSEKSPAETPTPKEPAKPAAPVPASAPAKSPAAASASATASSSMPGEASDENDPNRPRLRRVKPPVQAEHEEAEPTIKSAISAATPIFAAKSNIQLIPAISDAGGPEPQSYVYTTTPGQEREFREKMLKMASVAVQAYVRKWIARPAPLPAVDAPRARRRAASKPAALPEPTFQNIQLRVFDPSASNAPVLVLSAMAQMPPSKAEEQNGLGPVFSVTLIARQDIYEELHQIKANITDPQHLDVAPRMELIDVVDTDGNGQGEMLFRETSDQGSGFAIYRIIGDNLYNLFQSTPGE